MEYLLEILEKVLHYLHVIPIVIFFVVGIIVAAKDVKERLADYSERLRDKEHRYRVRTTTVKDMMGERETQTAKLRRLRVSKSTNRLILDPWPSIITGDSDDERPARLAQFYSVPGRLGIQKATDEEGLRFEKKFLLNLSRDEELKAHREYSTMLVYTLDEELDDILAPPAFIAAQPVGEECFTYEVHFPPHRRFVRSKALDDPRRKDKPKIRVFKGPAENQWELRYESYTRQEKNWLAWRWTRFINKFRTRYHVMGGRTDFGDRLGEHDWFRVTVLKPPKDEDIHICWCMEGDPTSWKWCSHAVDEHRRHER
jgi:hypothetical protein